LERYNDCITIYISNIGFSLIILVHEFGHFIFSKINKIFVSEFFLGFGPKLLKFKSKSGTLFGISAIPLGGYNKILGFDRSEKIPKGKEHQSFHRKPFYSKLSVIIAGSFMNMCPDFLATSGIFQHGHLCTFKYSGLCGGRFSC
jgi:regulator of sigma E protease